MIQLAVVVSLVVFCFSRDRGPSDGATSEDHPMTGVDETEQVESSSNRSSPPPGRRIGKSRLKRSLPDFSDDER